MPLKVVREGETLAYFRYTSMAHIFVDKCLESENPFRPEIVESDRTLQEVIFAKEAPTILMSEYEPEVIFCTKEAENIIPSKWIADNYVWYKLKTHEQRDVTDEGLLDVVMHEQN